MILYMLHIWFCKSYMYIYIEVYVGGINFKYEKKLSNSISF